MKRITVLTAAMIISGYCVVHLALINYEIVAGGLPLNVQQNATTIYKADNKLMKTSYCKPTEARFADADYDFIDKRCYDALPSATVNESFNFPVRRVIIAHTVTPTCSDYINCAARVRAIQKYHIYKGYGDIAYNFVVGGDGRAYEGRGYTVGACGKNYDSDSLCIAFIGDFSLYQAPEKQLKAAQRLIDDGIKMSKIHPNYALYGHRQLISTMSPGTMLYNQIMLWSHWSKEIIPL